LPTGETVRRLTAPQTTAHDTKRDEASTAIRAIARPEWWSRRAPAEPQLAMPLAPSRLAPLETDEEGEIVEPKRVALAEPATPAASAVIDNKRFLRGTLTHALLEHLPGLPATHWDKAAASYLDVRAGELTPATRRTIAAEALAVLRDKTFAPIFGPDSQAEVPVVAEIPRPHGKGPPLRLTGQIDRLVRIGDRVLIVDYKTNRPPPREVEGVAEAYLYQMAAYRLAMLRIFEGCQVSAAILWTDGARIMDIPDQLLDTYAAKLWTLDPASLDA
jgi:ATP-dependent helicase/nuclease subunit A